MDSRSREIIALQSERLTRGERLFGAFERRERRLVSETLEETIDAANYASLLLLDVRALDDAIPGFEEAVSATLDLASVSLTERELNDALDSMWSVLRESFKTLYYSQRRVPTAGDKAERR